MPRFALPAIPTDLTLVPRLLWAGLWIGFVLGTGTPQAALLCVPTLINSAGALLFLTVSLLWPVGHTPRGRPVMMFTVMMRAWGTLPSLLWLSIFVWIGGFGWSVVHAQLPRLAQEKAGEFAWQLLLCALLFGYAAQGWRHLRWVLGGLLIAGDAVLLAFYCTQSWALPGRFYGVLYAALLLPLAFWDARRIPRPPRGAAQLIYYWRQMRVVALLLFFALSLPPASVWSGLLNIWPGIETLLARAPFSGSGPGSFAFSFPPVMLEATPRLPGLFPGLWIQRLVEIGWPATLGSLLFVLIIVAGTAPKQSPHRALGLALRASIGLFSLLTLWLSPASAPAVQVTFLAVLALTAALRWGPGVDVQNSEAWPHQSDTQLLKHSPLSRAAMLLLAFSGLAFAVLRAPSAWRQTRAHWLDDQSLAQTNPETKLTLLRQAIAADPAQPAYWIHLARARLQRDGPQVSRVAASYLRVALHRAVKNGPAPDAALFHEIARLSLQIEDYEHAVQMAERAAHFDPFCGDYRLTLARAYALHSDAAKADMQQQMARRFSNNAPAHPANRYLRRLKTD